MDRLDGKVAIISGGARGMGAAHCRLFIAEGARVVLTDILVDQGEALAAELGDAAIFVPGDVTDINTWKAVVEVAEERFGGLDILVNNAGIMGPFKTIDTLDEADFKRVCDINQHATFLGMLVAIPALKKRGGGSIVNISSIAGLVALSAGPNIAYIASKFAVRGMSKAAAVELGPFGIRVNSVHPGLVMTQMLMAADEDENSRGDDMIQAIPLRRAAAPEELSNVVLFLACDESSYVSGGEFTADGALTAG